MSPVDPNYYLGIDAGGTTWDAVLCTSDYKITAQEWFEGMNLRSVTNPNIPALKVRDILSEMTRQARILPYHVTNIVLAGAGAGDPALSEALLKSCKSVIPNNVCTIVSDADAALEGAFAGGPGIIIIAGTGSIALGKDSFDRTARSGGYGHLLGDEGSGFWIGREAMRKCLDKHYSGGDLQLTKKICEIYDVNNITQAVTAVYQSGKFAAMLGQIAPLVFSAGEEGDVVALEIIAKAGNELGKLAVDTAKKLNFIETKKVALIGGLAKRKNVLEFHIKNMWDNAEFELVTPKYPPPVGAVMLGRKNKE